MSDIKVFGHLVPDTDATCSAIVYAWYLSNVKKSPATAYTLGTLNKETEYVLNRFGHAHPSILKNLNSDDVVVVVDTNNPEELLPDFHNAQLQEIVDHHKLFGGITTSTPIQVTMRPVACTNTIIWQLLCQDNYTELPEDIAGLMLSAIVSDTLNFTSPTVTDVDREAAAALSLLAHTNQQELADAMFEAKSDISGMSAKDLLLMDSKASVLGDKKVLVSVIETTKPGNALAIKADLLIAMEELKKEKSLDGLFFFVVDILTSSAQLIIPSSFERDVAERGFAKSSEGDTLELPGVLSRKKQMIPAIEKGIVG